MQTLLDETQTSRRLQQHGAIFAGIFLLVLALIAFGRPSATMRAVGGIVTVLGLAAIWAGMRIRLRWSTNYKGHTIRFENDPLRGEELYIDDELMGRGGLGIRMRIEGRIKQGEGAGDRIIAESVAGLLSFQCKLTAEAATGGQSQSSG